MSKPLSLLFATLGIFCLSALSISIAYSFKWVVFWGVATLITIGIGFVVKRRLRIRGNNSNQQTK